MFFLVGRLLIIIFTVIGSVLCGVKYYYQDFTTTLSPFILPDDSYNLWFERRSDNELMSIPLKALKLKPEDSLTDIYGFYIDQSILLVTSERNFLLTQKPGAKKFKARELNFTETNGETSRFRKPIPYSSNKFLVTPSQTSTLNDEKFKTNSNYFNLIEEYSLTTNNDENSGNSSKSSVHFEDTISLPMKTHQTNFTSDIIDQAYDKEFSFVILEIIKESKTSYLLIRFCLSKPLTSMIGFILIIEDNYVPKTMSLAYLGDRQLILIGFSSERKGSIEVYDVDDLHSIFDSIGRQCSQGESSKDIYLLPRVLFNKLQESECKLIHQDYHRCSVLSENQYIIGSGKHLAKRRLIRKKINGPILDSKIVTIYWPDPHAIIVFLSDSFIWRCRLMHDMSTKYCLSSSTDHLGTPKPWINFIHHTGSFKVNYVGRDGKIVDNNINLMECQLFTDCFTCRSVGYLWNCLWQSFECKPYAKNNNQTDSCFQIFKIYNRAQYSDQAGLLTVRLRNLTNLENGIKGMAVKILVENVACEVTEVKKNTIDCEYNGPIHGSVQLEVQIMPNNNYQPKTYVSIIQRITIINKPRTKDSDSWRIVIFIIFLLVGGVSISYVVQKMA